MDELRRSLLIVWAILSLVILMVLVSPFILTRDDLLRLTPVCSWKRELGRECIACGLTRSMVLISEGQFPAAYRLHKASLPLYILFVTNELGIVIYLRRRWLESKHRTLIQPGRGPGAHSQPIGDHYANV